MKVDEAKGGVEGISAPLTTPRAEGLPAPYIASAAEGISAAHRGLGRAKKKEKEKRGKELGQIPYLHVYLWIVPP